MPRKFKRYSEKWYYIKKKTRNVETTLSDSQLLVVSSLPQKVESLPLPDNSETPESLLVSIPRMYFSPQHPTESFLISIPRVYFNKVNSIQQLKARISHNIILPEGWVLLPLNEVLTVSYFQPEKNVPKLTLKVAESLQWTVSILDKEQVVPGSLKSFNITNCESFIALLQKLSAMSICVGNDDEAFVQFCMRVDLAAQVTSFPH